MLVLSLYAFTIDGRSLTGQLGFVWQRSVPIFGNCLCQSHSSPTTKPTIVFEMSSSLQSHRQSAISDQLVYLPCTSCTPAEVCSPRPRVNPPSPISGPRVAHQVNSRLCLSSTWQTRRLSLRCFIHSKAPVNLSSSISRSTCHASVTSPPFASPQTESHRRDFETQFSHTQTRAEQHTMTRQAAKNQTPQ